MEAAKIYVEEREGGYYVTGSRVSLDSIVYAYLRGESPEGIGESFPAVTLEQIFDALAFYLANRGAIDDYLSRGREEFARLREESRRRNPALYAKLDAARHGANRRIS
jgi:uncharacterized protein (DUF433 family)